MTEALPRDLRPVPAPSPLNPVFSFDIFAIQRFGGISRYFAEIHSAFVRQGIDSRVVAPVYRTRALRGRPKVLGMPMPHRLDDATDKWGLPFRACRLVEPIVSTPLGRRPRDRIHHQTYFTPFRRAVAGPVAITVYDMTYERYPADFPDGESIRDLKRSWCERADVIMAISKFTKDDVVERLRVDPEKVVVTLLGVSTDRPDPEVRSLLDRGGPFLLYVGRRGGYKNFSRFARAYARSKASRSGTRVVAFGGGPATPAEEALLAEENVRDQVDFTGGDDAALAAHYASALGLVFPSLDEGFGLPPLEAMALDCPVAAARAGAIPEVCADAVIYFEPTDVDSIAAALDKLVDDAGLRDELRRRGLVRAADFTWDNCARATLAGYEVALSRFTRRRATR